MKQIWKYVLSGVRSNTFEMPFGAQVMTVQLQNGTPVLWMLVDTDQIGMDGTKEPRWFRTYMTGEEMPHDPGQYIGTVQMHGGEFVVHIFEVN